VQLRPSQATFGFTEGTDANAHLHSSYPGQVLARRLLAHLDHHGLADEKRLHGTEEKEA